MGTNPSAVPLTVPIDQMRDTFVARALGPDLAVRMLYVRSQESRSQSQANQDYLCLRWNEAASTLAFCVADGVRKSYRGGFSSRFLSQSLTEWLFGDEAMPQIAAEGTAAVRARLDRWAIEAHAELLRQDFPDDTPPLVREVLAELRASHGSEAVFLAGRIDVPAASARPRGALPRVLLCWMGNVSAQLLLSPGRQIGLGPFDDDRHRWSTAAGCNGELMLSQLEPPELWRLIVHTDGLDPITEQLATLTDDEVRSAAARLLTLPTSDDMTLLDLRWHEQAPAGSERTR